MNMNWMQRVVAKLTGQDTLIAWLWEHYREQVAKTGHAELQRDHYAAMVARADKDATEWMRAAEALEGRNDFLERENYTLRGNVEAARERNEALKREVGWRRAVLKDVENRVDDQRRAWKDWRSRRVRPPRRRRRR